MKKIEIIKLILSLFYLMICVNIRSYVAIYCPADYKSALNTSPFFCYGNECSGFTTYKQMGACICEGNCGKSFLLIQFLTESFSNNLALELTARLF